MKKLIIFLLLISLEAKALLNANKETSKSNKKLAVFIGKYFPDIEKNANYKPKEITENKGLIIYRFQEQTCQMSFITNKEKVILDVVMTGECF